MLFICRKWCDNFARIHAVHFYNLLTVFNGNGSRAFECIGYELYVQVNNCLLTHTPPHQKPLTSSSSKQKCVDYFCTHFNWLSGSLSVRPSILPSVCHSVNLALTVVSNFFIAFFLFGLTIAFMFEYLWYFVKILLFIES